MPLVYAHKIFSQWDLYFLNGRHCFLFFLYPTLMPIWIIIEPLYLIQMCICTRSKKTRRTRSQFSNLRTFFNLSFIGLHKLLLICRSFRVSLSWPLCYINLVWYLDTCVTFIWHFLFIFPNAKWAHVHEDLCFAFSLCSVAQYHITCLVGRRT